VDFRIGLAHPVCGAVEGGKGVLPPPPPSEQEVSGSAGGRNCGLFNPLNAELNLICPLLALFGAHHILHVSTYGEGLLWKCVTVL